MLSEAHSQALIRYHIQTVKTYLNDHQKQKEHMHSWRYDSYHKEAMHAIEWLEHYFKID